MLKTLEDYIFLQKSVFQCNIVLYGFRLWYFKGVPLYQPLKELKKKYREEWLYK